MENYIQASLWCSDELTDKILVEAVERIEQEHNMLPQLTYEEVDDYFNVLQAPTLTSDTTDDVFSLPTPQPLHATVVDVFIEVMALHGIVPDKYLEAIYYITNQRCVFNPYGFSAEYGFYVHYIPRQPRTEPEVLLLSESDSGSSSGSVSGGSEADASSPESSTGMDTVE